MPSQHKAKRLAEYGLSVKTLSPAVIHETKRRVIDSFGCALGAWHDPVSAPLVRLGESALPAAGQPAQVFGRATRGLLEHVAFCNGGLVRALDFNDTYLAKEPAHPSDCIAPLVALAQVHGLDGMNLLRGIAISYEVQCRLCDAHSLRARGVDHVVYGNFSVATGAGHMLGFSVDLLTHALGIAGVGHTAIRQTREGEMANWKAAAYANAARNALFAIRAAQAGMTGPNPIFEGKKGLEAVVCGEFTGDLILPKLGDGPEMILHTYIKPYPVEYHAQSAVEAAIELHGRGVKMGDIKSIVIRTHKASWDIIASQAEKWDPQTKETADHSLPFCAAVALRDGTVNDASFARSVYRDPSMLAFLKKISCVEDAQFTADYGDKFSNHLALTMNDGRILESQRDYPLGHPKNAMTDAQVEGKFRLQAEGLMSKKDQDAFLDRCWNLDKATNLDKFLPILSVEPGIAKHE